MFIYGQVKVQTELGQEKRCMCCGEYWPSDLEFFEVMRSSRDGLTPRCIACIKEKLWQFVRPRPERAVTAHVPSLGHAFLLS